MLGMWGPGLDQNQAPTPFKTPPSPHRIFDLQDSLDKLMHFLPQLSDFVRLRNGFYFIFIFFFILRRMGKSKALAHHTSTYFHTRRVSI